MIWTLSPSAEGPSAEGPSAEGPSAEGPSAEDVFNLLDGNGDGFITEDELRGAAEKGGIALTDEQVAAFMAADADGDGVEIDEFLKWINDSVLGASGANDPWGIANQPSIPISEAPAMAVGSLYGLFNVRPQYR